MVVKVSIKEQINTILNSNLDKEDKFEQLLDIPKVELVKYINNKDTK